LDDDLAETEAAVRRLVTTPLTQNEFDALVSFTFNTGRGTLGKSTLLARLNAGDRSAVSTELLKYVYAGGQVSRGLQRRRAGEAAIFNSNECGT
jgi:lysozyme